MRTCRPSPTQGLGSAGAARLGRKFVRRREDETEDLRISGRDVGACCVNYWVTMIKVFFESNHNLTCSELGSETDSRGGVATYISVLTLVVPLFFTTLLVTERQ